ncbi:hypothetical protein SISNIDRAFT_484395 [Sistotremastrum niveocremeum HHB9708]|uniref:Uncharacterized protein n=1 Tax=Sistotremastrum niveocremeum HHB9708 TaxID=1314777 RepID=A0A164W9X2_9AGAM|nr:hypothetical protein SISNIDRAFT_484395 [Sistotremastrum niveocremeum HHB9708]
MKTVNIVDQKMSLKSLRRDSREAGDDASNPRTTDPLGPFTVCASTASLDEYLPRRAATGPQFGNARHRMRDELSDLASTPLTCNFEGRAAAYEVDLRSDSNQLMPGSGILDVESFSNCIDAQGQSQGGSEDGDVDPHDAEDLTPVAAHNIGNFQSATQESSSQARLEGPIQANIGPHRQRPSARVTASDPYYVPDNNRNAAARYRGSVKKGFHSLKRSLIERGTLPESQADSFSRGQILELAALTLCPPRDIC